MAFNYYNTHHLLASVQQLPPLHTFLTEAALFQVVNGERALRCDIGRREALHGVAVADNLIADSYPPTDVFSVQLTAGQGILERGTLLALKDDGTQRPRRLPHSLRGSSGRTLRSAA